MHELNLICINGIWCADSREVAEMIGKRHADLMRSIDGYVEILTNAKLRSLDFFIKSSYVDSKGEKRPCYGITRKGCDMVANKLYGEKGVLFTAKYVIKFGQMEKQLAQQPKPMNQLEILAQSVKILQEQEQKLAEHDTRIEKNRKQCK